MDVCILNNFNDLSKRIEFHSEYIGDLYDSAVKKQKIKRFLLLIGTGIVAASAFLLPLLFSNYFAIFGAMALFIIALLMFCGFMFSLELPPLLGRDLGYKDKYFINCDTKERAIKDTVKISYGWLINVKEALTSSKVLYIKFLSFPSQDSVEAILFYENDCQKVIAKPLTFKVELSTDVSIKDCILIDLYRTHITKYYSDSINTGVSYNIKTLEEYLLCEDE